MFQVSEFDPAELFTYLDEHLPDFYMKLLVCIDLRITTFSGFGETIVQLDKNKNQVSG